MAKLINDYISSYSVCAQSNVPRHFQADKLLPLEIPQRQWLHVAIDLPESEEKTTIMVPMDRL